MPSSFAPFQRLATPLMQIDAAQQIQDLNPACSAWLGLSRRRLLGQPLALLDGGDGSLVAAATEVQQQRTSLRGRHLRLKREGDERFAEVYLTPVDSDTALTDTEQRGGGLLLEFHPADAFPGADPSVLPAALHAALKGLAHEVRNPLAGLKGAAQLLGRRIDDPDSRRYVEVILTETARLTDLVERLLTPTAPRELIATNVHSVLERVRLLAEAEAGWSIQLLRDYDPSLPELPADADRLAQALWNLVRNALQSGASVVRLRSRAEHGVLIGEVRYRLALKLEVEDNGRGVPESLAERIFLPLVSGRPEGSGLGLALAQQVAREHGGALSFRSRPGHTVFSLLLPVREEHREDASNGD